VRPRPGHRPGAPKGERRLPKVLDTDRALQLLDGGVEDDFIARDQAILELFYSSGLRLSELTGLDLDHLDLADGLVQVLGKGSKTRVLPVGRKAREALQRGTACAALATRRRRVFVSRQGAASAPGRSAAGKAAGERELGQNLHPHMLRHSFASHCWNPPRTCARCRNCSAMPTSRPRRSTHLDFQHLAAVYDSAHPRAKRSKGDDS
jgi:integrase/recombinase XerC